MGLITKEVEVIPSGRSIKHYRDLGYDVKPRQPLVVKVEDLSDGSNVPIQYLCDYCNKEIITIVYADLIRRTKEVNKMACKHCFPQKIKDTSLVRYNVSSYAKTEECKEKRKNTTEAKYGVSHYSKTQEYKDKWNSTCINKYGESFRKQFMDKAMRTFSDKTGYDFPSQSPDVKSKMAETYYKNDTVLTSRQQLYIFDLYSQYEDVMLNYPVSYYNVDICFPEEKLTVEVDFGGHDLIVKTGRMTQKEFDQKEIVRNNFIKKEGYKQIHIVSRKDRLPNDTVLLQILQDARNYFSEYPNHSWIEFSIDTFSVRNAEHKDGIPYDFGALRTIKDSDLTKIENQNQKQNLTTKGA